jgi:hypothetical protein
MKKCANHSIFEDRHRGQGLRYLERSPKSKPGAHVRCQPADVMTFKYDSALAWGQLARQQIEKRCLAGTVGSYDADDFPFGDIETHVIDRSQAAEMLGYTSNLHEGIAH